MKDHPQENEPSKQPKCKQVCAAFLVIGGTTSTIRRFFLIANVYFAYIVFGVGALFLILPFAMLIYYAAKSMCKNKRHMTKIIN